MNKDEIVARILAERSRQSGRAGSEYDIENSTTDWTSIAAHYLMQDVRRSGVVPDRSDFVDSLIKAGAMIFAALEHVDNMVAKGHLGEDGE